MALKMKRSNLNNYENSGSLPTFEVLVRISEYFKISIDKLIKMDLSRLQENVLSQLEKGHDMDISGKHLRVLATTVDRKNNDNVELVPFKAKAGYTAGYADTEFIAELPTFQLPFLSRNKKHRTFQIDGDSMPPANHKSWVTGEFLQDWKAIKDGYPYIIVTKEEGIVFKIVFNKIRESKSLLLCSTNTFYEPYEIKIEDVLEVWKFTNFISEDFLNQ